MMSGKRLEEVLSWLLIKVDFQPKIMNSQDPPWLTKWLIKSKISKVSFWNPEMTSISKAEISKKMFLNYCQLKNHFSKSKLENKITYWNWIWLNNVSRDSKMKELTKTTIWRKLSLPKKVGTIYKIWLLQLKRIFQDKSKPNQIRPKTIWSNSKKLLKNTIPIWKKKVSINTRLDKSPVKTDLNKSKLKSMISKKNSITSNISQPLSGSEMKLTDPRKIWKL